MNYYRRYLGPYMKKTMHLSMVEHGAYGLMLDAYYSAETPLPADYDALNRICRAMTPAERDAVRAVANQYFPVGKDGLRHNLRADQEIGVAQSTIEKQRKSGVESSARRWLTDGLTGRSTDESTDGSAIQPLSLNQQPVPNNPNPSTTNQGKARASRARRAPPKTPMPDGFQVSERVKAWAAKKGFDRLDEHLESFVSKARAKAYTYADWDEGLMGAIRDDWARLRNGRAATVADRNEQAAQEWLRQGSIEGEAKREH